MKIRTEKISSVKKLCKKEHTYDLQVRDNNNFVLSNGVLSSNCIHTIWIYPTDNKFVTITSLSGIYCTE